MNAESCERMIPVGATGCHVMYCEECGVAGIVIGASRLMLESQVATALNQLPQEARLKLDAGAAEMPYPGEKGLRHVH